MGRRHRRRGAVTVVTRPISHGAAALVLLGAAAVLAFRPVADDQVSALALSMAALGLWATGVVPEYLTALIFLTLAMIFAVAPGGVVFAGFQAPALWLILGGLVMGVAVRSTGLGDRVARGMARWFGTSYWGVIAGMTTVGTLLGFCMPSSMGRAVLLMPIALSLADGYGFAPGSKGRIGVVLAAAFGSHVSTFSILPANVPNVVLAGAADSLYHYTFTYAQYLALHFPVLGLLKLLCVVPLIVWGWPDTPQAIAFEQAPPMSAREKGLAVLLLTALGFWATDALHHVGPAWVSMAAAVLLLLPGIGLVDGKEFNAQVNFGSLIYVGGVIGLGALVDKSGLGGRLAEAILAVIPLHPDAPVQNFFGLGLIGTLVSMVTTLTAAPAVLTPLAGHMAQASGLPLGAILNAQVLGFSNPVLPYESPPLVVAMALGGVGIASAQKLCVWISLATMVLLWPLDLLWWRILGVF